MSTFAAHLLQNIPLWLAENHVPALGMALIEDGRLKEARVFGELRKGVSAPKDTVFEVASLTKPIAALVTLRLVAVRQWDLDEPLCRYWNDPDVQDSPWLKKVTTRLVLSHRTGFPNWRYWNRPTTKLSFDFEPGTKCQYSGEGFVYLRRAIEQKFNKSWKEIADTTLLAPLGMKNTRWYLDETHPEPLFATRHDQEGKPVSQDVIGEPRGSVVAHYTSPAGALVTTIEDYGRFAADVAQGGHLSKKLFGEMIHPYAPLPEAAGLYYGLGWVLINGLSNGEYTLVHGGSEPGVRSFVLLLPKTKRGLVLLTNGDNGNQVCRNAIRELPGLGPELLDRLTGYL